jgi:hypothetical protein
MRTEISLFRCFSALSISFTAFVAIALCDPSNAWAQFPARVHVLDGTNGPRIISGTLYIGVRAENLSSANPLNCSFQLQTDLGMTGIIEPESLQRGQPVEYVDRSLRVGNADLSEVGTIEVVRLRCSTDGDEVTLSLRDSLRSGNAGLLRRSLGEQPDCRDAHNSPTQHIGDRAFLQLSCPSASNSIYSRNRDPSEAYPGIDRAHGMAAGGLNSW